MALWINSIECLCNGRPSIKHWRIHSHAISGIYALLFISSARCGFVWLWLNRAQSAFSVSAPKCIGRSATSYQNKRRSRFTSFLLTTDMGECRIIILRHKHSACALDQIESFYFCRTTGVNHLHNEVNRIVYDRKPLESKFIQSNNWTNETKKKEEKEEKETNEEKMWKRHKILNKYTIIRNMCE